MLRSMYAGIGGMKNFQTKLDVIGNNISNVNTYGFKKGRVTFKDISSQTMSGASSPTGNRGGQNAMQIGLGATLASIDTIHTNAGLQTTGRGTDVGIDGDGFFVVRNGNQNAYTRAGNFDLDYGGNLVSADGMLVQGYKITDGVRDTSLSDITIDKNLFKSPTATDKISFGGNLSFDTKVGTTDFDPTKFPNGEVWTKEKPNPPLAEHQKVMGLKVRDSLGKEHDIQIVLSKKDNMEWDYQVFTVSDKEENKGQWESVDGNEKGKLLFDEKGKLIPPNVKPPAKGSTIPNITINPGNGAKEIQISSTDLNFANVTQVAGSHSFKVEDKNGFAGGNVSSFNIAATGEVNVIFTNGQVEAIGQLALANFSNPGGLMKGGNNVFMQSNNSGIPNIALPGEGVGDLRAGGLEMSNVDLSEEFTDMIVSQRGFQANSRIITTSDQILEELVNLKR